MEEIRLQVTIKSKDKVYYDGKAYAVSSINDVGPFDVLSEHANFVTVVNNVITVHRSRQDKRDFQIERGILRVRENVVEVFVGF